MVSQVSDEQVMVTGLWTKGLDISRRKTAHSAIEKTMEFLNGCQLIAFYDEMESVDFLRRQAFQQDIKLISMPMPMNHMPAYSYVDDFVKRTLSYGLAQHPDLDNNVRDLIDKAWNLYWLGYVRYGEDMFRQWLSVKLSKVELTASIAPEISNFNQDRFTWIDHDFHRWCFDLNDVLFLIKHPAENTLSHFEGLYNYLGHPLPVSSYLLSARKDVWDEISVQYLRQIGRLGHFPYAYDEEILLSLIEAQKPEYFYTYGASQLEAQDLKYRSS